MVRATIINQHQQSSNNHRHLISQHNRNLVQQTQELLKEESQISNSPHQAILNSSNSNIISNGTFSPSSRQTSLHTIHRQQQQNQQNNRPYTSVQDSHYISHLRELENINFDPASGIGSFNSTTGRVNKNLRGKANILTCSSSGGGGGLSISSARRTHLVSRNIEFTAHQQHQPNTLNSGKGSAVSSHSVHHSSNTLHFNNNSTFGEGTASGSCASDKASNCNSKKTGSQNLPKTK